MNAADNNASAIPDAALRAYSEGSIDRQEALRALGLRDRAEMLVLLGEANLPVPPADGEAPRAAPSRRW